jgi:predicted nucleic acid-binding protein
MVLTASEIEERNRISFWDALIVAAANQAGAATIVTEGLNHGQRIEGILIQNPFIA